MSPLTGEPMRHKDLVPNYLLISSLSAVAAALSPNKITSSPLLHTSGVKNTIACDENSTSARNIVENVKMDNGVDEDGILLYEANKNMQLF
jgi:hypothetical protein